MLSLSARCQHGISRIKRIGKRRQSIQASHAHSRNSAEYGRKLSNFRFPKPCRTLFVNCPFTRINGQFSAENHRFPLEKRCLCKIRFFSMTALCQTDKSVSVCIPRLAYSLCAPRAEPNLPSESLFIRDLILEKPSRGHPKRYSHSIIKFHSVCKSHFPQTS